MTDEIQDQDPNIEANVQEAEKDIKQKPENARRRALAFKSLLLLLVFAVGAGSGFLFGRKTEHDALMTESMDSQQKAVSMMDEINPSKGYKIPAVFGNLGPQLVAAGAIDVPKFINLYRQQNKPLTEEEMNILTQGTTENVVINPENAHFLLNFFWAAGLTNQNAILTEGQMMAGGADKVGNFASTGGWTLGGKAATELFASKSMMTLTEEQQARLLEVASGVYRPCCNNPTHFPDCNHGMAMLGLLELMASQDASVEEMFDTAKYVTAFWYPQQMLEVATAFQAVENKSFDELDSKTVVSAQYASSSGFQAVHQWLSQNGLLQQAPSSGGSCGVR